MRIIFDISSVAPHYGLPGGLGRVETELAAYAFDARPDVQFSVFDPVAGTFLQVKRQWVPALIGTNAKLDVLRPSTSQTKKRWLRLPGALRWLNRFEYNLQVALERTRLTSPSPAARKLAATAVSVVSHVRARRKRSQFRPSILPLDVVVEGPVELGPDCILVSVGSHLRYTGVDWISPRKARHGFRYVVLCHDLILVQFPELVGERVSEFVRRHWIKAFPLSDLVVFTTRTVERDVRAFCAAHDVALGQTAVIALGWNPQAFAAEVAAELPPAVEPGKYVLMVSSLDSRKGHDLMVRVWKRLLAEGIPQSLGFKLVFVGGFGINTPHIEKLLADGEVGPTLVHFRGVVDGQLAAFYRNAAFCVFPSRYEGFGLPAIEALGAGKALIASTGGAIPEVVGGLAPCLDPDDEEAWYGEVRKWIVDPEARKRYEEKVRRDFRSPTWRQTGEELFAAIDRLASSRPSDNRRSCDPRT
jgi:glycosyltransferase involved in cell wall biosynthesis